ncbi:MAG: hypothetical protein HRT38_07330 [Alteromonadaceae bacterium]|nr:hypothetical protein [Alteromonadaceae bacterium]
MIVYANGQQWGKLLFERFKSGKNGIATTVSTMKGDDAYHGTRETSSQYLKIARQILHMCFTPLMMDTSGTLKGTLVLFFALAKFILCGHHYS